jgi:uncharacterized protein (TIGR02611 family)
MGRVEQLRAIRQRVRSTRTGRLTVQILVGLVGAVVVGIGVMLIPLPGPGWLIVLAGLAILATEFIWAERLLAFTRARLRAWWHWLGRQSWPVRFFVGLTGLAAICTVVALSLRYGLAAWSPRNLFN